MICQKCKVDKPESEFNKDPHRKTGLHGKCKACAREQNQEWLKTHKTMWVLRSQYLIIKEFIKSL